MFFKNPIYMFGPFWYSKTEYLECTFGFESKRISSPVEIEGREVTDCKVFLYLGSIIQMGNIREDIDKKIKAGWLK